MRFPFEKHTFFLITTLTLALTIGISFTIYTLYQTAFKAQKERLIESVKIQARLMESIALFDKKNSKDNIEGGHKQATLNQIIEAHQQYKNSATIGEFTLAELEQENIKFLLSFSKNLVNTSHNHPQMIKMGGPYAIPMQLALSGKSGVIVGKDYSGTLVLAAYEPVSVLNFGIVFKVDVADIKAPFIQAAYTSLILVALLIIIGSISFHHTIKPLIDKVIHNENDLRQLLNSTHEGIYGIDLDGNCTFANQACLTLLGYDDLADLIGQNMHNLIHHHYQDGRCYPVEDCFIFKAFKEGKGTTISTEVLWRKDGSSFPSEYSSYPVFENDQSVGAVVSFIDISERKNAQEQILLSEEKYRLAMEATQDGLWDWNIITSDVYYSPGWLRALGEDKLENKYTCWENRIYAKDKERVLLSLQQHLNGKSELWQEEHRLKKADGSYLWVLGRGQVVKYNDKGEPIRMIGTLTDIHDKKESEEVIWRQANFDSLTQLPNRKLFQELLNKGINEAQRDEQQLWLLFLDLDGFKEVNDTFGHHQGDVLLVQVSQRLQSLFRDADIIARLGGDEFVVILHDVQYINDIDRIASNIIQLLSEPYQLNEDVIYITSSIGIANYPDDANDAVDLLKFADQSMYAAKKEGKNRYTYFTPSLQHGSLIRIQLYSEIHKAISNNEFDLYYQPIVDLNNGEIHKAEALIRWNHPEKGFLNPGGFIQFAEETGIICDIGIWIFKNAFKQLQQWQSLIQKEFQLSINMSPLQVKTNEEKYDTWMDDVNSDFITKGSLVIEITEGLLLRDDPIVMKKLLRFRDASIQVAIDDFGTGYSSLSYLKEFDIDYLKIDQSFIQNLEHDSVEESLCQAIIAMAHALDLKVIAEGIETEQQSTMLTAMGCDYGQGYFYSKPIPAKEFEKLISKANAHLIS